MSTTHPLPFYAMLGVVGSVPLYFAAVQPWVWPIYAVAMALSGALHNAPEEPLSSRHNRLIRRLMLFFFGWTLLSIVPLPPALMAVICPFRARVMADAASLAGEAAVGWSALSYNPGASFAWWFFLLALALFFRLLKDHLKNRTRLRLLLKVVLAVAVLESLYGIVQALVPGTGVLWSYSHGLGTARGTYINRNHFAGFLELVFPLLLGYLLSFGDWGTGRKEIKETHYKRRIFEERFSPPLFLGVMAVMMLIAALFSQSRTGIVGIGVGFVVFSILTRRVSGRLPVGFWIGLLAVLGLTLVYGFRIGFEAIVERFMRLGEQDDIVRWDLWRDTWVMIQDHPFGIGLANFVQVFPVFKARTVSESLFDHAHNDYLQFLVECGWPGFIALAGAYVLFLGHCLKKILRMRLRRDPMRFFIAVGAFSGLTSLMFHNVFDFNLQIPANAVYFTLLLAILAACTAAERHGED